jgi:D-3-phosphoglycerate dehydrogenase
MHAGLWNKTSKGCHEVRHKVLGIVGYGHIGSQLSVLAEAMGMRVIFYDVQKVMPLGNSKAMPDLESLLCRADFVSLHVPLSPSTENMIGAAQLAQMKRGAFLLNASRGNVVVLEDLAAALRSGHLGGAYLDVFPEEPTRNGSWRCELAGMPNVLLTPHVAGSTEEAQAAIAEEVAGRFVRLIDLGDTAGAVNFAQVSAPKVPNAHRILNTHRNVPGVLRDLNKALENHNILQQCLATTRNTGYCVIDVDKSVSHQLRDAIAALPNSIKTRILY